MKTTFKKKCIPYLLNDTNIKSSTEETSDMYKISACDLLIAPRQYFDN